jgi:hypothetical protein
MCAVLNQNLNLTFVKSAQTQYIVRGVCFCVVEFLVVSMHYIFLTMSLMFVQICVYPLKVNLGEG